MVGVATSVKVTITTIIINIIDIIIIIIFIIIIIMIIIDSITDEILRDRYNHQTRAKKTPVDIEIINELEDKGLVSILPPLIPQSLSILILIPLGIKKKEIQSIQQRCNQLFEFEYSEDSYWCWWSCYSHLIMLIELASVSSCIT